MRKIKFIRYGLYSMMALGGISALSSCSDDLLSDADADATERVCFRVDPAEWGDMSDTRSGGGATSADYVLRAAGSRDTLCVRSTATPGIDVGKQSSMATRGLPVTGVAGIDSFGCFAYVRQEGVDKFYINNEEYKKQGDLFQSDNIYYWPGKQLTFDFYNYAPYDAAGLTLPATADSRTLSYEVPANVAAQQDLMLSVNEGVPGDNNAAVPLQYRHLLSAVRIVAGANMQKGTVKSVTFSNVYGSGQIDMNNVEAGWRDKADITAFSADVNVATDGTVGQGIADGENTFMMMPQDLSKASALEPVKLQIVFNDGTKDRLLETELTDNWQMGYTTTYSLSITPDFELEFDKNNSTVADAHYVIMPVTVHIGNLNGGSCTITSADPTVCKLRENLIGPEEQGYWPKEDTGNGDFVRKTSITVNAEGDVLVYAFLTENAGTSDRNVRLQLTYNAPNNGTQTLAGTWDITQKCPNWANGIGWENIEEDGEKPYGFNWSRKVTYKINGWANIWVGIVRILGGYKDGSGIKWGGSIFSGGYTCTLNYKEVQALSDVYSETDGLENTKHFTQNNAVNLESLEGQLAGMGTITEQSGDSSQSTDFAALVCLKKNPCTVQKEENMGQVAYIPSIAVEDIKWYLPASGQFSGAAGLTGTYWSSTAENDNTNAYTWNGSAVLTPRMDNHKVRAVRVAN